MAIDGNQSTQNFSMQYPLLDFRLYSLLVKMELKTREKHLANGLFLDGRADLFGQGTVQTIKDDTSPMKVLMLLLIHIRMMHSKELPLWKVQKKRELERRQELRQKYMYERQARLRARNSSVAAQQPRNDALQGLVHPQQSRNIEELAAEALLAARVRRHRVQQQSLSSPIPQWMLVSNHQRKNASAPPDMIQDDKENLMRVRRRRRRRAPSAAWGPALGSINASSFIELNSNQDCLGWATELMARTEPNRTRVRDTALRSAKEGNVSIFLGFSTGHVGTTTLSNAETYNHNHNDQCLFLFEFLAPGMRDFVSPLSFI